MTPDFALAIEVVLAHEGGWVDDTADPGGATQWGISLRYLRDAHQNGWLAGDLDGDGDVDADDIRQMTREEAIEIYRSQWWERYRYGELSHHAIALKVFDLAVNTGPGRAHRLLQQALHAVESPVSIDGGLGPATRAAVAAVHPAHLLPALRSEAAGFYRVLIALDRGRQRWERGWLRRAYS